MESWQGPVIVGADFNLIRFASDKIMLGLVINGLMFSMSGFISGSLWGYRPVYPHGSTWAAPDKVTRQKGPHGSLDYSASRAEQAETT
jgi:hypothetical protein